MSLPPTLSVNGSLRNLAGGPAPDGDYGLTFRIFEVAEGGNALWEEVQAGPTAVPVSSGVFGTRLGLEKLLPVPFIVIIRCIHYP